MDKEKVRELLFRSKYANDPSLPPPNQDFQDSVNTILENATGLDNTMMLQLYGYANSISLV